MDRIGLVCRSFLEQEDISQRGLAEILGVSLGSVNKLVSECAERGFLEAIEDGKAGKARYKLTNAGREYLAPYRMDGAVIFAAGFGSRFVPLTFEQPDMERFPCLSLAYQAISRGGNMPCILNAANEVANQAFRQDKITFPQLNQIIAATMQRVSFESSPSLEALLQTDQESRAIATEQITVNQ